MRRCMSSKKSWGANVLMQELAALLPARQTGGMSTRLNHCDLGYFIRGHLPFQNDIWRRRNTFFPQHQHR
jgi:hypothetical protein